MKFGIDYQAVSEKMMFENNGYIHVYSPGTGAVNPLRSIIFINRIIQSIWSFAARFPPLNDLNSSLIQTYR